MTRWREPALLLGLLLLVLLWDASGADWAVASQFGSRSGFAARHSFWASTLLHDGARWLSGLALLGFALDAFRIEAPRNGPSRPARRAALLATLLCLLLVPALKHLSLSSCPWSLSAFGGEAAWVSHWAWGQRDGGPGHCFPSGHAAGSFAFCAWLWTWRPWRQQRPGVWALLLLAVLGGGLLTSFAQWARGAHFVSHSLWSAWACAALSWLLLLRLRPRTASEPGIPSPTQA